MRTATGWLLAIGIMGTITATGGVLRAAPVPAEATDEQLKDRALKLNSETKTVEDADARLKELIKDKSGTPKLLKAAAKLQKAAKDTEKPFRFYAALVLAKAAHTLKEHDSAELFYKTCTDIAIDDLQSSDMIMRAAEGHMDYLFARKKYDALEVLCKRVLDVDGDESLARFKFTYVMEQLLLTQSRKGESEKALKAADELIKRFDGTWYFITIKARIYRDAEKYEDAIKTYDEVIDAIDGQEGLKKEDRERMIRNARYVMSGIYTESKQNAKAIEILKKLVKEDPASATFKNDLGFVMADNDMDIEAAAKLVREAVDQDLEVRSRLAEEGKIDKDAAKKANPAYIDSLGWVLYKQKKYDEALKYLLESAGSDDEESQSIEIWDHVADCYAAMGNKKDAIETYQKALKIEDQTKRDADRRKKVTEKLKKLKAEVK